MKRIAIFLGSMLILAVSAYFYFSPRNFFFFEGTSAYHAVPLDAPLFFEINSVRSIPLANAMFQELKEANLWQSFFSLSERFDSLVSKSAGVPSGLLNDKVLIAILGKQYYNGKQRKRGCFLYPKNGCW
jgi:hypothetical protein